MNSGFIDYQEKDCPFEYQNNYLKVQFLSDEWLNEDKHSVLEGKVFPDYHKVIFYKASGFYHLTGIRSFPLDMIIQYHYKDKFPIQKIMFSLDELDMMVENNCDFKIGINITDSSISNHYFSNSNLKNKKKIEIDGRLISFYLEYESFMDPTSLEPIKLKSYFSLEFDFLEDYDFLYRVVVIIRNLFSFLCYQKNICFREIKILSKSMDSYYMDIGSLEYKSFMNDSIPVRDFQNNCFFAYDDIENSIEKILSNIVNQKLGLRYISNFSMDRNIYTPERVIMIASSFENAFYSFIGKVEHKKKSIERVNRLISYIQEIEDKKDIQVKEKKQLDRFISFIKMDNYGSLVNEVLKNHSFLEEIVRRIYQGFHKNYRRDNFCSVIENIRNSFAHYKIEEELNGSRLVAIEALEMLIYAMQLYYSDISIGDVQNRIYRMLFFE